MTGPRLRTAVRIIRRVTVGSDGVVNVSNLPDELAFRAEVVRPREGTAQDGAPRSGPAWTIRWRTGLWGPQGAVPGGSSRMSIAEVAYELLSGPKTLVYGVRPVGYEASALPVASLYPFTGTLTEQSGTTVQAGLVFAMWSPSERHDTTGEYEDFEAEAPVDYIGVVRRNRHIVMGGQTYRVLTVTTDLVIPRVNFSLRRAGG